MSVLSASERTFLERMLQARSIRRFFQHVYGLSHLYANSKLALGQDLLRAAGLDPRRVLLVGDTVHDYEVASALQMRCLLMAGGHQSRGRLAACGCCLVEGPRDLVLLF
jgi:phosphoglycolate phosphatase